MNTFYPLTIKEINRETAECVSVVLDVPVELKPVFEFHPGQHLVFRTWNAEEEIRRSYSICTCPDEGELRVAVKEIPGGYFSTYMNQNARVGDVVEVMAPQGQFNTQLDASHRKRYVAIAAGSGITPIISIVKSILRTEAESEVILLYGNKNKGTIIFKEELEGLKNRYLERFSLYHILSRELADADFLSGRIDSVKIDYLLKHLVPAASIDEVFLCGPEQMILEGRDTFQQAGIPENRIHFELFYSATAEAMKQEREARRSANLHSSPVSKIKLKLDASTLNFELAYDGESILDAALRNGADLPYSCKGGVCATCKCKVEAGSVEMDVNYSLEEDELEQGFILACQSHPSSEELVLNFDIK
jgi:ring-1,2-phenylacetyl-CoA epoxidase subunit PaaE